MAHDLAEALWLPIKQRMPSYLMPFLLLSYPTKAPINPDSFKNSSYYGTGLLDLCLVVTIIAIMAILRDAFRLWLFEPFARLVLTIRRERRRQRRLETKINGNAKPIANGNGHPSGSPIPQNEHRRIHRSVIRFAEQGWSFVYYTTQCLFGVVRFKHLMKHTLGLIYLAVCEYASTDQVARCKKFLVRLSTHSFAWTRQILLSISICFLFTSTFNSPCRGKTKGSLPNVSPSSYHGCSYGIELPYELYPRWMLNYGIDGLV